MYSFIVYNPCLGYGKTSHHRPKHSALLPCSLTHGSWYRSTVEQNRLRGRGFEIPWIADSSAFKLLQALSRSLNLMFEHPPTPLLACPRRLLSGQKSSGLLLRYVWGLHWCSEIHNWVYYPHCNFECDWKIWKAPGEWHCLWRFVFGPESTLTSAPSSSSFLSTIYLRKSLFEIHLFVSFGVFCR